MKWLDFGMKWLDFGIFGHGKRINNLENRMNELEDRMNELDELIVEEREEEHEVDSRNGSKGVQIREENKEMRAAAMAEGRQLVASLGPGVLTDPALQAKGVEGIRQLTIKYPQVAEWAANRLFYEFRIEEPIKSAILNVVKQTLLAPPPAQSSQGEEAGYL